MNAIVVHYKELALKGRNRPWFVNQLVRNLRTALGGLGVRSIRSVTGRIEIELAGGASTPAAWVDLRQRIGQVFGIANFSYAGRAPLDLGELAAAVLADLGDTEVPSFRVSARRADKRFAFTSPQIEREVGGRVKQARGWPVSLDDPALTIHLEMLPDHAFYYFGKEAGAGGLDRFTSADRAGIRDCQLFLCGTGAARSRPARRGGADGSRRHRCAVVSGQRPACRQAFPVHFAADRA
jgi:thiamine biosynthesis protein ThiI